MAGISGIRLYEALRQKLGDRESRELVEFVQAEARAEVDARTNLFLIKNDKLDLINLMKDDKIELINLMKGDKIDLIDRIHRAKMETIVWIVGVGVLQFVLSLLARKFLL